LVGPCGVSASQESTKPFLMFWNIYISNMSTGCFKPIGVGCLA
jgi:hypothetical protein